MVDDPESRGGGPSEAADSDRKAADERLQRSEDRYRTLFDSITQGFCVIEMIFDGDGRPADYRFLEVNAAFERQTGLVDAVGRTMRSFAPRHEEHWFEIYGRIALTGVAERFERAADALGHYYDVYAFRVGEPWEHKVGILFEDVTERRAVERALAESEAQARHLLAELQHRVRNTLAVIRSIAARTAETAGTVEDYAMHLDGRLGAIARVQSAISRAPEPHIDLAGLIADELAAAAAQEGRQVTLAGPDVALAPRTAETLALAFHELTTNAIKYGALARPGGRIRVDWGTVGGELLLEWKESGVTLPDGLPARTGFGTELLTRMLPYQLGARTEQLFEADGLRCTIELPLQR